MKIKVEELPLENDKPIVIRFRNDSADDLTYVASNGSISIYIDEDNADKIAFQLSSILQDRERRKSLTK